MLHPGAEPLIDIAEAFVRTFERDYARCHLLRVLLQYSGRPPNGSIITTRAILT